MRKRWTTCVEPILFDMRDAVAEEAAFDAVFSANTAHIMS